MKKFKKKELNSSNGITLIALVITIIILLILAGISISMLAGDNGILQRATDAKARTEKAQIIENAKTDILGQIAENKGSDIKEDELKAILEKYFSNVPDTLPEDLSDLDLISIDDGYKINLKEIYEGNLKKVEAKLAVLDVNKFKEKIKNGNLRPCIDITTTTNGNSSTTTYTGRWIVQISSFEMATSISQEQKIEENIFSTSGSSTNLYVWYEDENTENIQTYNTETREQDEILEFITRKVYWWSEGTPSLSGNISQLFSGYQGTTIDLSQWNTSEVINMEGLFDDSKNLVNIDLTNWDVSNVTNMSGMFDDCSNLKQIDFRGKNTSKVNKIDGMFYKCSSLENVYFNNCEFAENCNLGGCFSLCGNLKNVYFNDCKFKGNAVLGGCFQNCTKLELVDFSNVDMSTANIGGMFAGAAPVEIIAPINVRTGMGNSVGFPGTQYNGSDGNTYTGLPEGKTESITLTKK